MKRLISVLLLLAMLLSCLPVSVSADDTAITEAEEIVDAAPEENADAEELPEEEPLEEEIPTEETPDEQSAEEEMAAVLSADGESFFYFSAEAKKELLIAPRKVPFAAGQRICDALEAAGITLKLTSDGFLSAINGVAKGYTVLSAPSALGLLNEPEAGGFVCVTENKDTDGIGEGWQLLMKQMVQYLQEAQDVRLAAKNAYDAACQNYCGVSDEDAKTYALAIQTAIWEYKTAQDTLYSVTFGGSFSDCKITAESSYEKQFEAESDGTLRLPNGTYTFFIRNGNRSVSGKLTVQGKDQKLEDLPALPTEEWIDTASFALSKTSDYNNKFDEERFTLTASEDGYTRSAAVPDTFSGNIYPYFCLSTAGKAADASITANYRNTAGETVSESITTGAKNKQLTKTLLRGASGNTVVFRVSVQDGSYAQNEELTLKLNRQPTLSSLYLEGKSGTRPAADKTFSGTELSYTYKILEEDTTVTVYPTAAFSGYTVTVDDQALDEAGGATVKVTDKTQNISVVVSQGDYKTTYTLTVEQGESTYAQFEMLNKDIEFRLTNENGEEAAPDAVFQATLSGGMETETITVTVKSRADDTISTDYKLTVKKEASTSAKITVTPADATLYIYEKVSGIRLWPDTNSKYCFSTGFTYVYSATKSGYVGQSGAIQLLDGKLDFGSIQKNEDETETFVSGTKYDPSKTISLKLDTAPKNSTIQTGMAAQWADFRGTAYTEGGAMTGTANTNNGVTSAAIPFSAESGTLYWAVNAGTGYSSNAVSNPILVDGNVVVYTGTRILKIDKDTGAILSEGTMAGKSSFAINNPTYAEGVILVGLSDGRIQAFNADTLESLWLYTDPLGGQPDSPITVANGYAYTGFWNSEVEEASFVCLSLTDEDPASKLEAKAETWRYVQKGGFYWAGAYACDDYVLIGTDDGEDGYSSDTANLLLLDPKSGKLLDSMTGFTGDIRCSICYDTATKAFYFTSKGGYLYSVQVQKSGSSWKLANKKQLELGGMSTSTPVVHNGRAYIGVSGAGQFTPYSGHNITVVNLSNMSAAYRMPTQGYPQTSGLLTTAYEKSGNGYVYVYFFDNYTPGKLRVLRDKAGQTTAEYTSDEYAEKTKYTTAYELFTPVAPQMQYALCSPIVDENGTLYFKNDSGYLMAYGSMVESLKLESSPTKTEYEAGEKFDPAGLKVTAAYANGITRDVTKLMKAADKALTQADTSVTLIYGLGQTMYHNVENTDKTMKPGEETASKSIAIGITVGNSTLTGTIGDLNWSFSAKTSTLTISGNFPSGASLIAAVYTADGKMVGTKILAAEGEAELPTGAKIKLFLLDTNGKPLCQSATVKGA